MWIQSPVDHCMWFVGHKDKILWVRKLERFQLTKLRMHFATKKKRDQYDKNITINEGGDDKWLVKAGLKRVSSSVKKQTLNRGKQNNQTSLWHKWSVADSVHCRCYISLVKYFKTIRSRGKQMSRERKSHPAVSLSIDTFSFTQGLPVKACHTN